MVLHRLRKHDCSFRDRLLSVFYIALPERVRVFPDCYRIIVYIFCDINCIIVLLWNLSYIDI